MAAFCSVVWRPFAVSSGCAARGSLGNHREEDCLLAGFIGKENGGIHLSVHGPNARFESRRFHIKIHRSLVTDPHPADHLLPRPRNNKDAQALTAGGCGEGELKDMHWFEESIVSKDFPQKYDFEVADDK